MKRPQATFEDVKNSFFSFSLSGGHKTSEKKPEGRQETNPLPKRRKTVSNTMGKKGEDDWTC